MSKASNKTNNIILKFIGFMLGLSFFRAIPIIGDFRFTGILLLILGFYLVVSIKKASFLLKLSLVIGFCFFTIIVNIINDGDTTWTGQMMACIACIIYVVLAAQKKSTKMIFCFTMGCNIWNVISFFDVARHVMFFRQEFYGDLLLCGYDNGLGAFCLPLICLNIYLFSLGFSKPITIGSTVLAALQVFLVRSMTPIVAVILLLIVAILEKSSVIYERLKARYFLIFDYGLFIVFAVLNILNIPVVEWFLNEVLKKTSDFSSRTRVWQSAMAYYLTSPITGHGRNAEFQRTIFYRVTSAHNFFLDVLTQSGIVGFIIITIVLLYITRKQVTENSYINTLVINITILLLAMQFESYCAYFGYPLFFFIITLALYGDSFISNKLLEKQRNKKRKKVRFRIANTKI